MARKSCESQCISPIEMNQKEKFNSKKKLHSFYICVFLYCVSKTQIAKVTTSNENEAKWTGNQWEVKLKTQSKTASEQVATGFDFASD